MVFGESHLVFANEAGEFTVAYSMDQTTGAPVLTRGGDSISSFMKVQEMQDKLSALRTTLNAAAEPIIAQIGDGEPNDEQMAQLNSIQEQYSNDAKQIYNTYFRKGGNTLIDWYSFSYMAQSLEPAEFVEYYEAAGSLIKNDKQLSQMYDTMQAAAKTAEGQQFVDYEMTNPAGETKKLSDFRAEGKYFLLDFFASWCGPCKMSMPVVAEIEKEFGSVLTSASIAVWESDDNGAAYAQAVKDLKITWPTFQDAKSEGAKVYGVNGVPTFVLFSPEGVILMRGHDIKAIQTKLRELNKK